jgi:hypothetical protein
MSRKPRVQRTPGRDVADCVGSPEASQRLFTPSLILLVRAKRWDIVAGKRYQTLGLEQTS